MNNLKENAIDMGVDTANDLVNIVTSEAPEVLDQLILLCTIKSIGSCVIGALFLLATFLIFKYMAAKPNPDSSKTRAEKWFDDGSFLFFLGCLATIVAVGFLIGMGITLINVDWIYLLIAPKAYIILELGKLL